MRASIVCVLLLSAASILPLAGCGSSEDAQPIFAGDFYILKPGRSWTYDGTYWMQERTRATVEYSGTFTLTRSCQEVSYAGQPALLVETVVSDVTGDRPGMAEALAGGDYYTLQPTGYYLMAHETLAGSLEVFDTPRLWLPLPLIQGQTWTWQEDWLDKVATATCTATGMQEVQVPLGAFDAVRLSAGAQASGGGDWFQYTWVRDVAPGIGIARDTKTSYESRAAGEQIWVDINLELHSYSDTHGPPTP